jgi:zinc transport system substrate-binding protein
MGNFLIEKNQKIVYSTLLVIGIISVSLTGCIENTSTSKIGVLVTIVPQAEVLEYIGGEYVDFTIMVPTGQDPHTFEPTPAQMKKVADATAYFKVGSGVEFEIIHMDTILEQNPDLQVYDCSEGIIILSFDDHYGKDDQHEDEDEEHDHEGTDPHIWLSPVNFKKMAEVVYNGLVELDSENQEEYYDNYISYISKLDNLHTNVSNLLEPFEGKTFLVYHPAWGYFGDSYNLEMIAIEDEGKKPGPVGIDAIINQALNENITVIFVAPQFDTSSAETIAEEINGEVVFANPLMTDYEETISKLSEDIVNGFKKS